MKKADNNLNGKVKKALMRIGVGMLTLLLGGVFSFYLAIGCGLLPEVQSVWIGSAMTTFHNHWLAEAFIPQSVIDSVINANKVDDSNVESTVQIEKPEEKPHVKTPEEKEAEEEQKYRAEGYEKLSSGVYLKEVTGATNSGKFVGYLMLCTDPSRVKLVDTDRQFSCGATVAMMIEKSGAVAGINGGGFNDGPNYDSNGGTPSGIIIEDGELVCPRNYDSNFRIIGINSEGTMILKNGSAAWAMENGLRCAVSAEQFLIVDGERMITKGDGGWGIAPRTALGQRKSGEIILLAIDGRQLGYSIGADLVSIQEILYEEGCINAAMMDGGSSTVMEKATYSEDGSCTVELINKPNLGTELSDQRYINNAWVIMPKVSAAETEEAENVSEGTTE